MSDAVTKAGYVQVQRNQFKGLVTWTRLARRRFDEIDHLHADRPGPNGVAQCITCHTPAPCATARALGRPVRARYAASAL